MAYKFNASHVFNEDDDYMVMLGFSDDEFEPSQFVILQKAHEYDDQDIKLGMDKVHIQVEDQLRAQYGGISAFKLEGNCLSIELENETKNSLKVDGNIEITLDLNHPNVNSTITVIEEIAKQESILFTRQVE
jgi:hypothetical protein